MFTCDTNTSRPIGDRYDEEPQSYSSSSPAAVTEAARREGKLDDIEEWDTGRKNIAQEAVGKVKDFVNRMKGFDEPPDYG